MKDTVNNVASALCLGISNAMTASEISYYANYASALQIANAVHYIKDVYSVKVLREQINADGERRMVEKTAYCFIE